MNPANCAPGVHTGPALGASLSAIGFQWKIHEKIFFSETTIAKAFIFGMQHCYVELYINPAKHALGVRNGPPWGSIAPLDLQLEKHIKNLLLRNHMAQSYVFPMTPRGWGPYGRQGHGWQDLYRGPLYIATHKI